MGAHLAGGLTPRSPRRCSCTWTGGRCSSCSDRLGSSGRSRGIDGFAIRRPSTPRSAPPSARSSKTASSRTSVPLEKTQWKRLLANRTVICLCLMYFTQTFGNAFYVTWLPTYLASTGLSVATAAILSGLPLTLSVVADLTGGITTDMAARRLGLRLGRVLVGGGALTAAGLFTIAAAFTDSPIAGAVLIALGGASSNFLLGAAWGTCLDIGGRRAGALSGAMNTSGQVGAILSPILIALVVQRSGFRPHRSI